MIKNACFSCDGRGYTPLCSIMFCYCVHRVWLTYRRKRVFGVRVHVCFVVLCYVCVWTGFVEVISSMVLHKNFEMCIDL